METEEILVKIREADMILVGLGEDFDDGRHLHGYAEYVQGRELLRESGCHWLLPAWKEYCLDRLGDESVTVTLQNLAGLLEGKNYFVVSTATNRCIAEIPWKQNRVVMPCGNTKKKQCAKGCEHVLEAVTETDRQLIKQFFDRLFAGDFIAGSMPELGRCSECGGIMVFNTVYAENYNESGYMEGWQLYTKWLQGTLNRKLVVLELGVGMQFPSVIRWPFEKVAYFNKKADFVRVNERLYQLTEELSGKGCGIPQNAIDWLKILC